MLIDGGHTTTSQVFLPQKNIPEKMIKPLDAEEKRID
jgi:hypothetical protein